MQINRRSSSRIRNFSPLLHTQTVLSSHYLTSSIAKALLFLQPQLTRRTQRHSLGNLNSVPPPQVINFSSPDSSSFSFNGVFGGVKLLHFVRVEQCKQIRGVHKKITSLNVSNFTERTFTQLDYVQNAYTQLNPFSFVESMDRI